VLRDRICLALFAFQSEVGHSIHYRYRPKYRMERLNFRNYELYLGIIVNALSNYNRCIDRRLRDDIKNGEALTLAAG
jgi:hypothetical protein